MGSEGTTPDETVVPLVTSSPSIYDSLKVNASPAVVISAPMGVYPTAVPDESAPRPPKELPDFTDIFDPLTEYVLPIRVAWLAAPSTVSCTEL